GGVSNLIGMPAVGIQAVAAEGGDFDDALLGGGVMEVREVAFLLRGNGFGVVERVGLLRLGLAACGGSRSPRRTNRFDRHQDNTELRAHGPSLGKNAHHLVRSCVGGDVVVGGLAAKQKVAHASPNQVGLVAALAQSADDFNGGGFYRSGHAVSAPSIQHSASTPTEALRAANSTRKIPRLALVPVRSLALARDDRVKIQHSAMSIRPSREA